MQAAKKKSIWLKLDLSSWLAIFQNLSGFPGPLNILYTLLVAPGRNNCTNWPSYVFLCVCVQNLIQNQVLFFFIFVLLRSCLPSKTFACRSRKLSGFITKRWMRKETALSEEWLFTFKDRKQTWLIMLVVSLKIYILCAGIHLDQHGTSILLQISIVWESVKHGTDFGCASWSCWILSFIVPTSPAQHAHFEGVTSFNDVCHFRPPHLLGPRVGDVGSACSCTTTVLMMPVLVLSNCKSQFCLCGQ